MADQEQHDTDAELDADTGLDAGTDEEMDVEGFATINTTRSNIKSQSVAPTPGLGGVAGGAASGLAIKEQGVR